MNTNKIYSTTKKAVQVLAAVVVSIAVVACGKKDDGGARATSGYNNGYYNYGMNNCYSCGAVGAGSGVIVQAQAATGGDEAFLTLNIVGLGGNAYMMDPWTNPITSYAGPIALEGGMNIVAWDSFFCGAAPGSYQLRTVQVGNMMSGSLSGVVMEALGPQRLILQVGSSVLYGVNSQPMNPRLGLTMMVESVNGQPCGSGVIQTY